MTEFIDGMVVCLHGEQRSAEVNLFKVNAVIACDLAS